MYLYRRVSIEPNLKYGERIFKQPFLGGNKQDMRFRGINGILTCTKKWNTNWSSNLAFHFTKGKGYFEQYREDEDFTDYGLNPITLGGETINVTDLIRRRWLDNDFYGTTFSLN